MFCLQSLCYHKFCISFLLIGIQVFSSFFFFFFFLKLVNGNDNRSSNQNFDQRSYFNIKIEEISSFDLYSIVKSSFFWFELWIRSFINIIISLQLSLVSCFFVINGGERIHIFILFLVFILIFDISILLLRFDCFGDSIETVLSSSSGCFSLTKHMLYLSIMMNKRHSTTNLSFIFLWRKFSNLFKALISSYYRLFSCGLNIFIFTSSTFIVAP